MKEIDLRNPPEGLQIHSLTRNDIDNSFQILGYDEDKKWGKKAFEYNGDKYLILEAYIKEEGDARFGEFGHLVLKNEKPVHVLYIYEPHGFNVNEKRGLITTFGHENIINLWLDNGEHDKMNTR